MLCVFFSLSASTCLSVCKYLYIYIYIYIYIEIYIYIYIYICRILIIKDPKIGYPLIFGTPICTLKDP